MKTITTDTLLETPKRKMSLSISASLADKAKRMDINLSRAAEAGILQEIQRRADAAWLRENRTAIKAYNARIEHDGLFADEQRGF